MSIVNLSAYRFVPLDDLPALRERVRERAEALALKGTVLLAPEGINLFLAGPREATDAFMDWLREDPRFAGMEAKASPSDDAPFGRLRVRLKKEIITLRQPQLRPVDGRAPAVDPATLKRWLDQGHDDDGREVLLLDTRNAYETDVGKFPQAVDYRLGSFTEFPDALAADLTRYAGKTVVSYCTGGIRCEKAALYMQAQGMERVFQLDGGVLKYFEETGGAHWDGGCFVFDGRGAVDSGLLPLPSGERACPRLDPGVGLRGCADLEPTDERLSIGTSASPGPSPQSPSSGSGRSSPQRGEEAKSTSPRTLPLPSGERVGVRGHAGLEPIDERLSIDTSASPGPSPQSSPQRGEEAQSLLPLPSGERVGVRGHAGLKPTDERLSIDTSASPAPSPQSSPQRGEEAKSA